jgi:transposase
MAGKKGMKQYSRELKLEAMRMFYEEGKTRKEITEALGVRDPGRVKIWLRKYRAEGEAAFDKKRGGPGRPPKKKDPAAYIARLEMENELLKKYHSELRKGMLAKRNIGSSTDTGESTP